jgi:fatty acid desaturase
MSVAARRPALPRELYEPSVPLAAAFVLLGFLLFFGGGALAAVAVGSEARWVSKGPAVLSAALLAQQGAHLLAWAGHEGIHLSLHRNRYVSVLLGSFVAAASLFPAVGYGLSHWNHHRFTNTASDPDVPLFAPLTGFWSRLLLARSRAQRSYLRLLGRTALGRAIPFPYRFPFPPGVQATLARLNVAFLVFWVGAYAAVAAAWPLGALVGIGLPLLLLLPFSGLRVYVEHARTEPGPFRDARSYVARLYTVLFFGNNYHLEHHLYPTVPCYRLPAVHRFLQSRGYHATWGSPVDPTLAGPARCTLASAPYAGPAVPDGAHDPFGRPGEV